MLHSKLDSYNILWENLWHQQNDVYRRKHGDSSPTLTYESYDFSSLPRPVLPGKNTKFIIRKEYCIFYDTLRDWYGYVQDGEPTKGVIVTGHPGIGKSISLWYILVTRLLQRQPTVIEADEFRWFLFDDTGVHVYMKASPSVTVPLGRDVWVLVDSNHVVHQPAGIFTDSDCDAFIVQATSPQVSRYNPWRKQVPLAPVWTMDIWSPEELEFTSQVNFEFVWTVLINGRSDYVWEYSEDVKKSLRRSFEFFGPSPRVAKQCLPPGRFQARMKEVMSSLPLDITAFRGGLNAATNSYNMNSHRWCLVVPDGARDPKATLVSLWVMKLIMERQADATAEFLYAMYDATTAIPSIGPVSGKMFEGIAHTMLWNGRYTATGLEHTNTFQVEFTETDRKWISFAQLQELEDVERRSDGTRPPIYAQPTSVNYATADSIAILDGRLHMFQMTTNREHTINLTGLEAICDEISLAMRPTPKKPLRFVWVIPFDKSEGFGPRGFPRNTEDEKKRRWGPLIQQYVIKLTMGSHDFLNSKIHANEIVKAIKWGFDDNDLKEA